MTQPPTPTKVFGHGPVFVKVSQSIVVRDGETQTFPTVVIGCTQSQDGQHRTSSSFTLNQIPTLIRQLEAAYDEMLCLDGQVSDDFREHLTGGKKPSRSKRNGIPAQAEAGASNRNDEEVPDRTPTAIPAS